MSRPPLAPKITDTLYDMYEDAKKVNELTSVSDLERKLAIIRSVNEKITRQLTKVNQSTRPDKFMKRKLESALEENETIQLTVENSLSALLGAGDRLALSNRLQDYERQIADLQRLLRDREEKAELDKRTLTSRLKSLTESSGELNKQIATKDSELQALRLLRDRMPDGNKLESRIKELEDSLIQLRASHSSELVEVRAKLGQTEREYEECQQSLSESLSRIQELTNQIQDLSQRKDLFEQRLQQLQELPQENQDNSQLLRLQTQLEEKERQLDEERIRKDSLEREASSNAEQLSAAKQRLSEVNKQLDECNRGMASSTLELQAAQRELSENNEELDRLRDTEKGLIGKNAELVNELKKASDKKSSIEKDESGQKTQELSQRIEKLTREKESCESQLSDLQKKLKQTEEAVKETAERLRDATEALTQSVQDKKELGTELENLTRERDSLTQSLSDLRKEQSASSSDLQRETASLRAKVEQLEREASERNSMIEERVQEIISLKQQQQDSQLKIQELQQEIVKEQQKGQQHQSRLSSLETELTVVRAERDALQTKQQETLASLSELQKTISTKSIEIQQRESVLQQKEQQLVKLQADISTIQKSLSEKTDELSKVQADKNKLEAASKIQGTQLSDKMADCQRKEAELQRDIEKLTAQNADLQTKISEQVTQHSADTLKHSQREESLTSELTAAKSELAVSKAELDQARKELLLRAEEHERVVQQKEAELSKGLDESQKNLESQLSALQTSESEKELLRQSIGEVEQKAEEQLRTLRTELQREKDSLDSERVALQRLKDEHAKQISQLEERHKTTTERFTKEIKDLQDRIEEITQKSITERELFKQLRSELETRLNLSDQEKQRLDQLQAESKKTIEQLREELDKKQQQLVENQARISQYEKDVQHAATEIQKVQEAHQKSLSELGETHQKRLSELGEEKIREQAGIQKELDTLKQDKEQVATLNATLRTKVDALRQTLVEKEARIAGLEDEKGKQLKLYEDRLKEKCPTAIGDIQKILLEGFYKAEIYEVQQEEIDLIKQNMENTLQVYKEMSESELDALNVREIGASGLRRYILLSVYLLHAWKAMLRLPLLLRGGLKKEDGIAYMYKIPMGKADEQLRNMINTSNIITSYSNSIVDGEMRIDVLLYYMVIAMSRERVINRASSEEEFKDIIVYLKEFISHANNTLASLIQKIRGINQMREQELRITHNNQTPIVTFIRLSSKTPSETNKRFKYQTIQDKIFQVEYSDQPEAFYDKGRDIGKRPSYNADYYFGPFTHVFQPNELNEDIASSKIFRQNIEAKLRQGIPVCIIGYGASGSGKTTTLIYADYTTIQEGKAVRVQQPGILILLANNLAQPSRTHAGYDRCSVTIYELEADPTSKDEKSVTGICRKYPAPENSQKKIRRLVRTGITDSGQGIFVDNVVPYEDCDKKSDLSLIYEKNDRGEWENKEGDGIEKQLVEYINVKRNIAPSPNNPQSSRSHIVCILTFANTKGETTSLIVCDFAGVENKFNCLDQKSLDNMGIPEFVELEKQKLIDSISLSKMNINLIPEVSSSIEEQLQDSTIPFEYINKADVKLLSEEDLAGALEFCSQVLGGLKSIPITTSDVQQASVLYYKLIGDGGVHARTTFDFTKIKDYRTIMADVTTNKNFKPDGARYHPLFQTVIEATKMRGFSVINYYYTTLTGSTSVLADSFISIIRMILWFLYSYKLKDAKKISISNLLKQSMLSQDIRSRVRIPNDNPAFLLTEQVVEKNIKASICQIRVNEGIFINKSLAELRKFIGDTMQASKPKGAVAPFIDKCAPIQCNPYYRDCFGQNDYYGIRTKSNLRDASSYGLLSKYIASVPNSKNMVFCVMTVVNLSKDANNPPPSPYVDITDLQIEYEKLLSHNIDLNNPVKLEDSLGFNHSNLQKITKVCRRIIQRMGELRVTPELIANTTDLITMIEQRRGNLIDNIGDVIDMLTNFNAITAIGTLEFTDMMAKYAVNRVTCNTREQKATPSVIIEEKEPQQSMPRIRAEVDESNIIAGGVTRAQKVQAAIQNAVTTGYTRSRAGTPPPSPPATPKQKKR
jgi:chromosome segregation ATPase